MFDGETLSSIIFRLLNFGVLIAFFTYIFKKSLLPDIRQEVTCKEKHRHDLKQHRDDLKTKIKTLEHELEAQDLLSKELALKVARWHDTCATTLQQRKAQEEKRASLLHHKTQLQSENLHKEHLQAAVIPEVIHNLEEKLQATFASPSAGTHFMDSILMFMKKGNS
ncbi:MAG TPA: hypothetical protein VLG71_02375 [Candidatus Limnocylindria bacterium]|nr:hypothetical protein [Candidatus Limnocylindria bacterium]